MTMRWNGTKWALVPSPTPGGGTNLNGVAAISARKAWAVGVSGSGIGPTKTLILRWNGTAWKRMPSPSPRASAALTGVAVTSGRNAWAVGFTRTRSFTRLKTLILRWNGNRWE
jgi:hypothetical protein